LSVFPRESVFIVSCDDEILNCSKSFGAKYIKTSAHHQSGTSRVQEALISESCDLALIVQADEPLLDPTLVKEFATNCISIDNFQFSNIVSPLTSFSDLSNPSIVKCVHTLHRLVYFFRLNPYTSDFSEVTAYTKKLNGIYCYNSNVLQASFSTHQSNFSLTESIEQLHLLEQNYNLSFFEAFVTYPDVNTPSDYEEVRRILATDLYQRSILRNILP